MLKPASKSKSNYSSLCKSLRLINPYRSGLNPNDSSYVYAGFAPISIRLIEMACRIFPGGEEISNNVTWNGREDILQLLPGRTFENISTNSQEFNDEGTRYSLIVFIGGCTYSEVSALRYLSQTRI